MPNFCCVPGCKGATGFGFPLDPDRKLEWVNRIRRRKWSPGEGDIICGRHFRKDDFVARRKKLLDPRAVPSVFQWTGRKCVVEACGNSSEPFVRFVQPWKDPDRARRWARKTGLSLGSIDRNSFICSKHFAPTEIELDPDLNPELEPLGPKIPEEKENPSSRFSSAAERLKGSYPQPPSSLLKVKVTKKEDLNNCALIDWKANLCSYFQFCQENDLHTDITISNGSRRFSGHRFLLIFLLPRLKSVILESANEPEVLLLLPHLTDAEIDRLELELYDKDTISQKPDFMTMTKKKKKRKLIKREPLEDFVVEECRPSVSIDLPEDSTSVEATTLTHIEYDFEKVEQPVTENYDALGRGRSSKRKRKPKEKSNIKDDMAVARYHIQEELDKNVKFVVKGFRNSEFDVNKPETLKKLLRNAVIQGRSDGSPGTKTISSYKVKIPSAALRAIREEEERERTRLRNMVYKCQVCENTFKLQEELAKHRVEIHVDKELLQNPSLDCSVCYSTFNDTVTRLNHELSCHLQNAWYCYFCDKRFGSQKELKVHYRNRRHHRKRDYVCQFCSRGFYGPYELKKHENVHRRLLYNKCRYCDESFDTKQFLDQHENTHPERRAHMCEECGKGFAQSKSLKSHMATHSNDKPYSCQYCKDLFKYKVSMHTHIKKYCKNAPKIEPQEEDAITIHSATIEDGTTITYTLPAGWS